MNSYILLLVLNIYAPLPDNFQITEFSSKQSCEIALDQAKGFWKTVNDKSKCLSVKDEIEKKELKKKLNELKEKIGE